MENRRSFLAKTTAAAASAGAAPGILGANERITLGLIGGRNQGRHVAKRHRCDYATGFEILEVTRDSRLWDAQQVCQLAHPHVALGEEPDDSQTGGIAEGA